jgi:putative oxidoreductase
MWSKLSNYKDVALLFFRLIFGAFFILVHGFPKLAGGLPKWKAIGASMKHIGITFWPGFWGFMAAFSETIGIGLLMIGFAFRPSCLLLIITMSIATLSKYGPTGRLSEAAHPFELALVFAILIFIGPGKYSVDKS